MLRDKKHKVIFAPFLGILLIAVIGLIVMWLWNWLIPELFKGPQLTFLQAIGLLVLSKILLSGIGRGHDRFYHSRHNLWRKRFEAKFNNHTRKAQDQDEDRDRPEDGEKT